jgi:hypothetical protein
VREVTHVVDGVLDVVAEPFKAALASVSPRS